MNQTQTKTSDKKTIAESVIHLLSYRADELMCRVSVERVSMATAMGKALLPAGYWGTARKHISGAPHVYLTFDDGPNPKSTPQLLELLEKEQIKATFFLIGKNCEKYPELVKAIHDAGHVIGNHTYTHDFIPKMTAQQMEQEIVRTNDVIASITGEAPKLFRPPFGVMDERTAVILRRYDMTPVYWSSAPEDWLNPGSHRVIRRVMWKVADGTLIVLHEGSSLAEQTVTAAKEIISRCKADGYDFSKVNMRA